jgi:hypothetical protein
MSQDIMDKGEIISQYSFIGILGTFLSYLPTHYEGI